MTESWRGRITEVRRKYLLREEEETLDQARRSQEKKVNRLQKHYFSLRPEVRNSFLEALSNGQSFEEVNLDGQGIFFKDAARQVAEELLAVKHQGLQITRNAIFFNKINCPDGDRYTDQPYENGMVLTCSPYDPEQPVPTDIKFSQDTAEHELEPGEEYIIAAD